jgi:putative chitinase
MGTVSIEQSVGFGGRNKPIDVAVIQCLLKAYFTEIPAPVKGRSSRVITPSIAVDGECTTSLVDLIKDVQSDDMGAKHPDGRIDPHGKTLQTITSALNCTAGDAKTILFGPAPTNTDLLPKVDAGRFRKLFPRQVGEGLTISKGEDLLGFFGFLQKDTAINDIRWAAYMLATAYAETEFSFLPVEEKGKGASQLYGREEEVTDVQGYRGPKNATYKNRYYGRGYCQLTGPQLSVSPDENNYRKIGNALGLGDELYINPAKALDKKTAYNIISYGMRHGTFTDGIHKLSDHINGKKCDYKNARRIINGLDRYDEIARYAEQIELLLRLCASSALTAPMTCFR